MPTYFGDDGALTDAPALARSVLGTADPGEVARELDAFCAARLGSGIGGVFLCEVSVGAVFSARVERGPVGMRGCAYEAPTGARRPTVAASANPTTRNGRVPPPGRGFRTAR